MESSKKILEAKFNILVDAISFISITNVDVKFPFEDNISIYIKTNDINTIDLDKMKELVAKYSKDSLEVTFLVPETMFNGIEHVKNTTTVCIFLLEK